MKFLRTIFAVIIVLCTLAVGVLFALQNDTPVPLDMLIYSFAPKSLALWLLVALALGGVLGMLMSSGIALRQRAAIGAPRRQLEKVRAELDTLRTAALKDGE